MIRVVLDERIVPSPRMIAQASSTTASVLGSNPVVSVSKTRNNCERMAVPMFQSTDWIERVGTSREARADHTQHVLEAIVGTALAACLAEPAFGGRLGQHWVGVWAGETLWRNSARHGSADVQLRS